MLGANGYTGTTTIGTGAVLDLGTTGSLASTPTVNVNGGSLLLGGVNQVNANAALNLGGTVNHGGGTGASNTVVSQTFGSLTLTANSVIDFSGLAGSSFTVTGAVALNGNSLKVYDWKQGDSLVFALGSAGVNIQESDLANVQFFSDLGQTAITSANITDLNGNAIVPVPEPGVVVSALLLVGMMLVASRRRIAGILARHMA